MVVDVGQGWNLSHIDSTHSNLSAHNVRDTLLQYPAGLSRTGHTLVAVCLGFIFVLGILNNFLVLVVFAKFQCLWTPINLILLNISVSDILVCLFGTPFSFAASIHGRWLIGDPGCRWYGFANSLFGIVSLVSLSVLSYERYSHVLRCAQADVSDFRKAWLCVGASWVYSLLWTLPPLLGWSSYGPEGVGTSCSVQWHVRSASSVSYVLCLFVFCLLLPLLLMVYCYGRILLAIRGVGTVNLLAAQRREQRVLLMVLSMVAGYLLCWMPYGVVALVAAFGPGGAVTPLAGTLPAVLAKLSTVVNPVIYVFFNSQFNACFVAFIKCSPPPRAFTTHQGSRPQHRTSGSRHSHNSPAFRSALPTSPLPYSCRSPEFTSYCVAPKEGELMHDLAVHYNH
ncbi:teleost multiple tissue opsin 3a [Gadus macrocephalus]|uniref:teleost multiple tissue opsin 3a n=1 Tax=Gadus macrocephalus TaxID=80720 RepID=UPI0028CB959C|nr:teleost multiple tissue opsin 3a [Gadus macrocephalus]